MTTRQPLSPSRRARVRRSMRRSIRRAERSALWAKRLLPVVAALLLAWAAGLVWFARDAASMPPGEDRPTDAIIVLTGGSERLRIGLGLLADDKAEKLFVSGVYAGVDVTDLLRVSRLAPGELECCIVLGYAAGDTIGNAAESAEWVKAEGYRSVRLVTSNYHMARSLIEFRHVLPDIEIVPHPVHPAAVEVDAWWHRPGTASLMIDEYNKYLASLGRNWLLTAL